MTNSYPVIFNVSHQLRKVEDSISETPEKKLSFLYIGHTKKMPGSFPAYFENGIFTEDFYQAGQCLSEYGKDSLPDVIFIDQLLNESELQDFCFLLKEESLFVNTIIIYNDEKLDQGKVKFLKQNELVDDAMNFNSLSINYSNKISFLKKIKSRQGNLTTNLGGLKKSKNGPVGRFIKRTIDVLLASAALILLLPLFLLIVIAIRLESRGPVVYTSKRAGKGFRIFKFYKFRTMEVDADKKIKDLIHLNQYGTKEAKFLKLKNDPRVTQVGKFLRNTSIDEMPQLINVLKGDMSLVGNRPLPLYEATELTTNESVERFMAPAGMTGLWQIKKRGNDKMSVEERINLDIIYARNANLIYDLWIIANTPGALFQKSNV